MSSHDPKLLAEVIALTSPESQEKYSLLQLTDAATRVQSSLREAQADSPTINSDACVILLTGEIGRRCSVYDFGEGEQSYLSCCDKVTEWLNDTNGRAPRARAADAAQGGAVNLTPLARSLHKAVEQVIAEGGKPELDPAIRLIAHQMTHITSTYDWKPDCDDAKRMRAMAQAQLARHAISSAAQPATALKCD